MSQEIIPATGHTYGAPITLRATISGSNVKLFFLNEENAPLLPALSF